MRSRSRRVRFRVAAASRPSHRSPLRRRKTRKMMQSDSRTKRACRYLASGGVVPAVALGPCLPCLRRWARQWRRRMARESKI
uniref:Uncharacterized protein n=1 Tax=Zea mays TaxID=4577 RepID=C4J421_MAIZE|nr:unknown [Zea mays]